MASIEQLVCRSRQGDQEAFCELVDLYKAYVFAIILNFVKEKDEAENIAQEVFLQIYRSLSQYRFQNFKAWAGKIALSKSIDYQRKKTRLRREELFPEEEWLKTISTADLAADLSRDDPERILLQQERKERVQEVCLALPEVYRRTIQKYYLEEKSYQQIAVEEKVAIKTVESRLYRAKKLFRERWGEGG